MRPFFCFVHCMFEGTYFLIAANILSDIISVAKVVDCQIMHTAANFVLLAILCHSLSQYAKIVYKSCLLLFQCDCDQICNESNLHLDK